MRRPVPVREGDVFGLRGEAFVWYALVARVDRNQMYCYFFDSRTVDAEDLRRDLAVAAAKVDRWQVAENWGEAVVTSWGWRRDEWPMPSFGVWSDAGSRGSIVTYSDTSPSKSVSIQHTSRDEAQLHPKDASHSTSGIILMLDRQAGVGIDELLTPRPVLGPTVLTAVFFTTPESDLAALREGLLAQGWMLEPSDQDIELAEVEGEDRDEPWPRMIMFSRVPPDPPEEDEFDEIEATLRSLATRHNIVFDGVDVS
jgi:hypothetical protein